MSIMAKDSEILSSGGASAARPEESAARTQPVALEVPVSVNGARTVGGSDKREPFSEATKTVLIFATGAVIRLGSTVAAGQLLFLTNDNTKKEVVCQVVKSRHYSGVSGYVELEFTEPATGFWGMRFPAERPGALQANPGTAKGAPTTQKSVPAGPPSSPVTSKPEMTKASTPAVSALSTAPGKPASVPCVPATTASDTDELKREAARLQDQLSGVLFADGPGRSKQGHESSAERPASEAKAKIIEMPGKADTPTSAAGPQNPGPSARAESKPRPDLTAGEVKIPAWLEPLARNASIPAPPDEPQTNIAEAVDEAPAAEEAPAILNEGVRDAETPGISGFSTDISTPTFSGQIFGDPHTGEFDAREKRSGKGVLIGLLAAGVIAAAAGGVWYFKLWPPASGQAPSNPPVFATLPPANRTNDANAQAVQEKAQPSLATEEASARSAVRQPAVEPLRTASAGSPPIVNAREKERIASSRNPESANATPVEPVEQQKKPALGQVKLATPMVNAKGVSAEDVAAPHFGSGAPLSGDPANAGLMAGSSSEPAAPVPVGGEVRSARLLHGIPPVYPPIAKSQRISGDVKLDALVDATGHVTTMKIVSGPVLLHQAAMDAVHQWRYQPAMLDGKPVPMHLTVTVQFRLQ